MAVKKKPVYETFGNELSPEVALLQAASALDSAAFFAVESRDSERLTEIAAVWMELAGRMIVSSDEEPEIHEAQGKEITFGFKKPLESMEDTDE